MTEYPQMNSNDSTPAHNSEGQELKSGPARLNLQTASLITIKDDLILLEVEVLGRGFLRISGACFIDDKKEFSWIKAPQKVKLKVPRSTNEFHTYRHLIFGKESFKLHPALEYELPTHSDLNVHYKSVDYDILNLSEHIQPGTINPPQVRLDPAIKYMVNPKEFKGAHLLNSTTHRLNTSHSLKPNFVKVNPRFVRKAPSHES